MIKMINCNKTKSNFLLAKAAVTLNMLYTCTTRHLKENSLKVSAQSIMPFRRIFGHKILVTDIHMDGHTERGCVYRLALQAKKLILYKQMLSISYVIEFLYHKSLQTTKDRV